MSIWFFIQIFCCAMFITIENAMHGLGRFIYLFWIPECRLIKPTPQSIYCRRYAHVPLKLNWSALHRHISRGNKNLPVESRWWSRGLDWIPINNQRDTNTLIRVISLSLSRARELTLTGGNVQVRAESAPESDGAEAADDPLSVVHYSCIKIHYARGGIIKRTHSNMH